MKEPRTYRHPSGQYIFILLALLLLGGGLFLMSTLGKDPRGAFFVGVMFLFLLVFGFFTGSNSVTITDSSISSKNILGEKSLAWGEIRQVRAGGGLRLKNMDGDVTVSIPSELPGFEEIVDLVGMKRPDLFSAPEFSEIDNGLSFYIPLGLLILLAGGLAVGVTFYIQIPGAIPDSARRWRRSRSSRRWDSSDIPFLPRVPLC